MADEEGPVNVEMPRRQFSAPKIDMKKLSAHASVVNSSILDNIVSKFSIVSGHHVRGRWRPALAIAIIVIPILAFSLMLWYQIRIACIANCQYYPLINHASSGGTSYSTESTILNFLGQESIHFCSSTVSQLITSAVDDDNVPYTAWLPCTIRGHDYSSTGTCAAYQNLGKISSDYDNGDCFSVGSNGGSVAIFYTACVPAQTALVNSVQVALYSAIGTIVLYLMLRVMAKHGVVGLFQPAKWTETLNNKAKIKNDEWLRLGTEKEDIILRSVNNEVGTWD
jgi:hypothetical protein